MISSQNALLYAYAFYLFGKTVHGLPEHSLQKLIGRWFFFTSLTGRYTSSPETVMDSDLNRLKSVRNGQDFVRILDELIASEFTNDYWTITLPAQLDSSSARNPGLFAYVAAQNSLQAPVLFSHKTIKDLLDPAIQAKKQPLERHHLFPRAWLEDGLKITDLKLVNQMANQALLEWPENIEISDDPPVEYVPKIRERFSDEEKQELWNRMNELHALPIGWEAMDYLQFLDVRRQLMAQVIRRGYQTLV